MEFGKYVMGISTSNHDRAVALCQNGKIVCAISEERLDRRKHSEGFYSNQNRGIVIPPLKAINYVLEKAEVSIDDIDLFCVGRSIKNCKDEIASFLPVKDKEKIVEFDIPSHHYCHAASSMYSVGVENGYVIVADEQGHWINGTQYEAMSLFEAVDGELLEIDKIYGDYDNISVGMFYDFMTYCIGFSDGGLPAAGKTMGLSAYGKHEDDLECFFEVDESGVRFRINYFLDFLNRIGLTYTDIKRSDFPNSVPDSTIISEIAKYVRPLEWQDERAKRVAYIAQNQIERVITEYLSIKLGKLPECVLCSSGGIFLNTNLNSRVLELGFIKEYHPFPAATDDGCAIGLAFLGARRLQLKTVKLQSVFLGRQYSDDEILYAIKKWGIPCSEPKNPEERLSLLIKEGKTVGAMKEGSEFGPRALGNRSIFARPDSVDIRDRINIDIKHREVFRPLAPAVQEEYVGDYFEGVRVSPYMLFVSKVIDSRLVGVTHKDGTARIQTVSKEQNGFLHALLENLNESIGMPICINTSFNVNGNPLVESPDDAVVNFLLSDLDILLLGEYIIDKSEIREEELIKYRRTILQKDKEAVLRLLGWTTHHGKYQEAKLCFETIRDTAIFNTLSREEYANFLSHSIVLLRAIGDPETDVYIDKFLALAHPEYNFSDFYSLKSCKNNQSELSVLTKKMKKIEKMGYIRYLEREIYGS